MGSAASLLQNLEQLNGSRPINAQCTSVIWDPWPLWSERKVSIHKMSNQWLLIWQEINGLSQKSPWELGKWWVTKGPNNRLTLNIGNSINIQAWAYISGKVLMRSLQHAIDHQNPTDGREDICVLQLVANGLVEGTSRLQTVVAQSIPIGIDWFLRKTKEQRE